MKQLALCFGEKILKKEKTATDPVQGDPPDIILGLDKDLEVTCSSDYGLAKFEVLKSAGAFYHGVLPERESIINSIRQAKNKNCLFEDLEKTSVTFGFDPEAAKTIKNLKKKFERKNIKLRIDVGKEDAHA